MGDEPAQRLRRMHNIGIRQKKIFERMVKSPGDRDALAKRPQLAGPSGGQRRPGYDCHSILRTAIGRHAPGEVCCAVAAVIVDQDDRPRPRVVLTEQRIEASADAVGLIARRS